MPTTEFDRQVKALREHTSDSIELQRQAAILKTGALQDAIFKSIHFSSIATDENGVIQIFNVGAERMLGYAARDVVDLITPADISDPGELLARAAALSAELGTPIAPGFEALVYKASRGIEDIYELTYVRKDGRRFPAIVSVTALRGANDILIGFLLIGTDNTARKLVAEARAQIDALRRDQAFYTRSLIESHLDALMMTTPLGVISDVNEQMIELTGYGRHELIGTPCRAYFTAPARADLAIARVLAEGRVSDFELTVRARDGGQTQVSYNAATFCDRDGVVQGVFAAARDVTERTRVDRVLLEKNIELEQASRMKSEFLATMSHELRTPLNAIIGFSEALKDGLVGELSAIQNGFIDDIFTSGQHLLSLINDILDLSKVEAGMMTLELEAADVHALLSNSLTIVRERAANNRIALELEAGEHLGAVLLDVRKTKQIVYNLLSNAVKFSAAGGRVILRARRVARAGVGALPGIWPVQRFALADNEHAQFLELCVIDSGLGIAAADLPSLFQAFRQIDSSLARKFEGTGLGLAMIKRLAELHGGTVAVASAMGQGSRFAVWLPLRVAGAGDPPASARATLAIPPTAPPRQVALVVEDDAKAAELARLLLEDEGFTVLHAASAEEALDIAARQPLSLITLDILLPGMDGWEFLRRIRADRALAQVPVVIMSVVGDDPCAPLPHGAVVLRKPIGRAQLKAALRGVGLEPAAQSVHTVLVVDDDPKAVEVIAGFLPAPSYAVVRAYGGHEAVALAQRLRPDLILLDLMMPDMGGFEVVDALLRDPGTARIPVLLVTAGEVGEAERARLGQRPDMRLKIVARSGLDQTGFLAEVRRALAAR